MLALCSKGKGSSEVSEFPMSFVASLPISSCCFISLFCHRLCSFSAHDEVEELWVQQFSLHLAAVFPAWLLMGFMGCCSLWSELRVPSLKSFQPQEAELQVTEQRAVPASHLRPAQVQKERGNSCRAGGEWEQV